MQVMICAIAYGTDCYLTPDTVVQELVPDVHARKFYKRYSNRMFFKSHDLPDAAYKNVIYIVRDGRDVMISYLHMLSAMSADRVPPTFENLIIDGAGLFPCKWHDHVERWLQNPFGANLLVVKYEDLKADTVSVLQRVCGFLSVARTHTELSEIAAKSTFDKMRHREVTQGWDNAAWPKDARFVRRGGVGGFRDEFPSDLLNYFAREAGSTLRKLNYDT